jgi:hypothetical protein
VKRLIKSEWDKADKDKSGTLDFKEIERLLDKLNLKLKDKEVKKRFKVENSLNKFKESILLSTIAFQLNCFQLMTFHLFFIRRWM